MTSLTAHRRRQMDDRMGAGTSVQNGPAQQTDPGNTGMGALPTCGCKHKPVACSEESVVRHNSRCACKDFMMWRMSNADWVTRKN